jgi:hypothetical protein
MSVNLPQIGRLVLGSSTSIYQRFFIRTSEDTAAWAWQGYVYAPDDPATPLVTLAITWDSESNTGVLQHDPADVLARLDAESPAVDEIADLRFGVMGKPGTTDPVLFFAGPAALERGGPAWV